MEAAAVEQAGDAGRGGGIGQQTDQDGADEAADQVHADDVERVVVAEAELQRDGQRAQRADPDTEEQGAHRRDGVGGGGDADQAGDHTGGGPQGGGVTVADPLHDEPADDRRGGGGESVDERGGGDPVGAQRGPGVEAEPADEQQGGAEHHRDQVAGPDRGPAEALTLAEDDGESQPRSTGVDVDRGATGEVDRLQLVGDPAADHGAVGGGEGEDPVGHREVDDARPDQREDDPGTEFHPVGDGAGDQRDRDDREGGLEGDEGEGGDGAGHGVLVHQAPEPGGLERIAQQTEAAQGVAERCRVPEEHPEHSDPGKGGERHHHHVQRVLRTGHAAVEEGERGCRHQQHQRGTDQYPGGVAGIDGSVHGDQ
ncbi:hypothetical protein SDC9_57576 [bioreactor metagenome]|uniref:Uncharacterized protein n=1 Tax=bioreactor metagenome TaxID=1076179 RepID=A0A644X5K7_9ZZZZ